MADAVSRWEFPLNQRESSKGQLTTHQSSTRDGYIDFIRGLVIFDMILVHYSSYLPEIIYKIINYHDIAIEGFLLASGFLTGKHYFPFYLSSRAKATAKILTRSVKLIIVQYILILTISYPTFLILSGSNSSGKFLYESFLFQNQIGLMHILPLFIALSIISPLILFLLSKNWDYVLILGSLSLFWIGQTNPDPINYGGRSIFPIVLWQIYFVLGCYLGKKMYQGGGSFSVDINKTVLLSSLLLAVVVSLKHIKFLAILIHRPELASDIIMTRFPLNFGGLFYGLTLMFFVVSLTLKFWGVLSNSLANEVISLFGRHSLLMFSIHVCLAKIVDITSRKLMAQLAFAYLLIILNFIVCYFVARKYECGLSGESHWSARSLKFLFG